MAKAKPVAKTHLAKNLGLKRQALPHSIVEVIATLTRAGYEAYIVGGGVRDSLLGLAPKDFDAVTNARPHEIKDLFGGRCRIIGRRFQLAHVYSGREMIEVATFRAPPKDDTHTTDGGMITRDNVWGDITQDFARRDFSINALYYEPIKGEIKDFSGALDDIDNKTLRLLGNPAKRIEEDPVRLLRALRFKAKLGFEFDRHLAKQFNKANWALMEQVSTHRLYDETQKMFSGGYLEPLLPLLYRYGAMDSLCVQVGDSPTALMMHVAKNTDERVANERGANPAYFYAVLLWENYLHHLAKFKKKLSFYDAQVKAAARTIDRQRLKTAIPKFAEDFISDVWILQSKLTNLKAGDVELLLKHPRFRAAYDFLVARESADTSELAEPTLGMGLWWTQYQLFDTKARQVMIDELGSGSRRRRQKEKSSQSDAELHQLLQLSLAQSCQSSIAKPLFDNTSTPQKRPRPIPMDIPVPVFDKVYYSDEEFAKLLADEPFIPAKRRHKKPSGRLSIKEQLAKQVILGQAISDDGSVDVEPKVKPPKDKAVANKPKALKPKPPKAQANKVQDGKVQDGKVQDDKVMADKPKTDKPKRTKKPKVKQEGTS